MGQGCRRAGRTVVGAVPAPSGEFFCTVRAKEDEGAHSAPAEHA
jgi:hypothetical protein